MESILRWLFGSRAFWRYHGGDILDHHSSQTDEII
jgi:hypothetical protein